MKLSDLINRGELEQIAWKIKGASEIYSDLKKELVGMAFEFTYEKLVDLQGVLGLTLQGKSGYQPVDSQPGSDLAFVSTLCGFIREVRKKIVEREAALKKATTPKWKLVQETLEKTVTNSIKNSPKTVLTNLPSVISTGGGAAPVAIAQSMAKGFSEAARIAGTRPRTLMRQYTQEGMQEPMSPRLVSRLDDLNEDKQQIVDPQVLKDEIKNTADGIEAGDVEAYLIITYAEFLIALGMNFEDTSDFLTPVNKYRKTFFFPKDTSLKHELGKLIAAKQSYKDCVTGIEEGTHANVEFEPLLLLHSPDENEYSSETDED